MVTPLPDATKCRAILLFPSSLGSLPNTVPSTPSTPSVQRTVQSAPGVRILHSPSEQSNLRQMEQHQRRNEWVHLTQHDFPQAFHEQAFVPEDYSSFQDYGSLNEYFPVQGDTPAGSQDRSLDSLYTEPSPYGALQTPQTISYSMDDDALLDQEARDFADSQQRKRKAKGAKPKQDQPKSNRQIRRQQVAEENQGEVSATDQPKGLVEWRQDVFKWWDPSDKVWRKAAYHDQYRNQFIAEDTAEGRYVVVPARGKGANDITTPCSAFRQLEWNVSDRNSWGNILDNDGNKVMYLLDRPQDQSHDIPDRLWIHDGCVLLDGDNNPVRPWAGIPRCFSTKIEGGRMEALRRILPLTMQDFRARMLRHVPTGGSDTKPLSYPSTFSHRMARFRSQYQCPAWEARAASDVLRKQVTDQLSEGEDATTTEGLQVLTRYEVERRKLETRGRYLYKATGRALSEEERKARARKEDEKLARQAAQHARTTQRRPNVPATPSHSASPSPYLPTPPLSAGKKRRLEDTGLEDLDAGQSEPAAKRSRHDVVSRLNPRLQSSPLTTPPLFEDQFEHAPATYEASGTASPRGVFHGHRHGHAQRQTGSRNTHRTYATKTPRAFSSNNYNTPEPQTTTTTTPQPHTTNPPSPIDYRYIPPLTPHERLRIQSALFYPRAHYLALTGQHAPPTLTPTSTYATYFEQYSQLMVHLRSAFAIASGGDEGVEVEVPALADVGPWRGSFDEVPRPWLGEEVVRGILGGLGGASAVEERGEEAIQPVFKSEGQDADGWNGNGSGAFYPGYSYSYLDGNVDPFSPHLNFN